MKYYRGNMLGMVNIDRPETYMSNPYPDGFEKVNIPTGVSGDWAVEKFTVDKDKVGLYNLRLIRDGRPDRVVPEGTYTRLVYKNKDVVMSDTPAEGHEQYWAYIRATGNVIVNGLGLGFFVQAIAKKPIVVSITVIEKSPDVIKLVGDYFSEDSKINIINADAFDWQPPRGSRYDYAWHDIWTDIDPDNKIQMKELKKKYRHRASRQGCWSEQYL